MHMCSYISMYVCIRICVYGQKITMCKKLQKIEIELAHAYQETFNFNFTFTK